MCIRPHPELDPRRGVFARQRRRIEGSAPGDQAGKFRLHLREQMVPHRRPDAVGADQGRRQLLLPRVATALDHGQPLGVRGDVLELAAKPQIDIGAAVDLGLQRILQIGAVHHPIGRAGLQRGGFAKGQAGDLAAGPRADDVDGLGRHRARRKPRPQPEVDQDAAGVRRQLQAGPGFLQPLGLLQDDDAKALCGERKRCRQSPDPGTSNDDGARSSHRKVRRPCPSPRIPAGGPRPRRGRRRSGTAWSNTDR